MAGISGVADWLFVSEGWLCVMVPVSAVKNGAYDIQNFMCDQTEENYTIFME